MAKMRVHELAKEIDMESKDLIALLEEAGIEGKKAASSLEDDQVELVRKKVGKKAVKTAKAAAPAEEGAAAPEKEEKKPAKKAEAKAAPKAKAEETPAAAPAPAAAPPKKKKSNIIFVSNPHNSQNGRGGMGGQRPQGAGPRGPRPEAPARPQGRIVPNVKPLAPGESRLLREREEAAAASRRQTEAKNAESNKQDEKTTQNVQAGQAPVQRDAAPVRPDSGSADRPRRVPEHRSEVRTVRREGGITVQTQGDRRGQGRPMGQGRGPIITQSQRGAGPGRGGAFGAQNAPDANRPGPGRRNDKRSKEKTYQTEDGFRGGKNAKGKQVKQLERPSEKKNEVKEEEKIKVITLPENLTIKELAEKMKIQPAVIIK
ncbi:MAG: translation initiation factor IF-2 N-terminal domain-containing protein, partial [Lachnospiraceae bacterium]|nr:translation initiation factor IF-2 N-terminal domain-containing protein [Lachnospiraceae bacterium]